MNNSITKEDILFGGVLLHSLLSNEEDYIAHYGRLGMKWYQHIFGEYQGVAKYAKKGEAKLAKAKAKSEKARQKYDAARNKKRYSTHDRWLNYVDAKTKEEELSNALDKVYATLNSTKRAAMSPEEREENTKLQLGKSNSMYQDKTYAELSEHTLPVFLSANLSKNKKLQRSYENAMKEFGLERNSREALRALDEYSNELQKAGITPSGKGKNNAQDLYDYALNTARENGIALSKGSGFTEDIKNYNKAAKVFDEALFNAKEKREARGEDGDLNKAYYEIPKNIRARYDKAEKNLISSFCISVLDTDPHNLDKNLLNNINTYIENSYRTAETKGYSGRISPSVDRSVVTQKAKGLKTTGHTNEEIAEILGISPSTVSEALNGKYELSVKPF